MRKKILLGVIAGLCSTGLVACSGGTGASDSAQTTTAQETTKESAAAETSSASETSAAAASSVADVDYIKGKGTLIVGITDFAPMDYKENGDWVGFDADLAKKVAEDLGVKAEFVEIDWDNKILELDNKSIDVVWNGMTLTNEVKSSMECTNAYLNNAQVVVVPADKAADYKDKDSIKDLTFAVEAGSAGEEVAKENGYKTTPVTAQSDTLLEVKSGTSDAAIIDLLMAGAMIGEGTSYSDLAHTVELNKEEYGIGCRKGSDLAAYINDELKKFEADGSLKTTAEKYGVQEALIELK